MNQGLRLLVALLIASLAAPLIYVVSIYAYALSQGELVSGMTFVLVFAWLVCLAHLVLIGLPVFAILSRRGHLRWSSVSFAGFLAGALPLGVIGYPSRRSGYSSGANWHGRYVALYENGEPTRFAWLSHIETSVIFGLLGVVAAVVLWRMWALLGPGQRYARAARARG